MSTVCLKISVLEIWGYNSSVYEKLTDQDVTEAVNAANMATTFSYPMNFTEFLGSVTRNGSGYVTAAKTAIAYLVMRVNRSEVTLGESASHARLSEEVDAGLYNWEEAYYIQLLLNQSDLLPGLKLFLESQQRNDASSRWPGLFAMPGSPSLSLLSQILELSSSVPQRSSPP
ncbi:uncharacterized protein LOC135204437 [Macrobrachium nipponense]|uniref:uncharacterized protein LOC135204437 n=1 Tax=Macrobrachium nipponense TaxID=159736 RepID=UPI0030C7E490